MVDAEVAEDGSVRWEGAGAATDFVVYDWPSLAALAADYGRFQRLTGRAKEETIRRRGVRV